MVLAVLAGGQGEYDPAIKDRSQAAGRAAPGLVAGWAVCEFLFATRRIRRSENQKIRRWEIDSYRREKTERFDVVE